MKLTIDIPMVPDKALLPNNRRRGKGGSHWSVQSEATADLRMAAFAAIKNAGEPVALPLPVVLTYDVTWPYSRYKDRLRIPDADAVPTSCKAICDALVDAGWLGDDGEGYVSEVRGRSRRGAKGEPGCVVLEIEA